MASWIAAATSARGHTSSRRTTETTPRRPCFSRRASSRRRSSANTAGKAQPWSVIQGPGLELQQSQVVQRIKHEVAALIGALVPFDDLAGVADHHRIHVSFHLDLAMAIAGRHGVVVATVTYQADRTHPARPLIAGIKGNRGQHTAGLRPTARQWFGCGRAEPRAAAPDTERPDGCSDPHSWQLRASAP